MRLGRSRVAGGACLGNHLAAARPRQNVGIAFAARLVVAAIQPATSRHHADIAGAVKRRDRIGRRQFAEPGQRRLAGVEDRRSRARGVGGTARDAAVRQGRQTGMQFDLVRVEAERFGRDLRQRRPGALSHIGAGRFHQRGAVGPQCGPRRCRKMRTGKQRRAHAPADQVAVLVAHPARRQRPVRPAELPGPFGVAFAQRLGRERLSGAGLYLGVVGEPEVERIHATSFRRLVHCHLQGGGATGFAGRAHRARRSDVQPQAFMLRQDGGARIQRQRSVRRRLDEVVKGRRRAE